MYINVDTADHLQEVGNEFNSGYVHVILCFC